MLQTNKLIRLDVIDLQHTDEELALIKTRRNESMNEKNLMQNLLDAITHFLDIEQELGFLSQADVDRIVVVEDTLNALLIDKIVPSDAKPQASTTARLAYTLFDDDSNLDARFKRKNAQLEI